MPVPQTAASHIDPTAIDLTPRRLAPVFEITEPRPAVHVAGNTAQATALLTQYRRLRVPAVDVYSPAQVAALVMEADEITFNITELNIGRKTYHRMGHVGATLKQQGRVLTHLDGLPSMAITQPDGTAQWVPMGMGEKHHSTKLFAMTPRSIAARNRLNGDNVVHRNVGSINLAELPPERREEFAAYLQIAMEAINDHAHIPYIVPGSVTAVELVHLLWRTSGLPVGLQLIAQQGWLQQQRVHNINANVSRAAFEIGGKIEAGFAPIATALSPHRIVPDAEAPIHGCNSKDILLAVAGVFGRRAEVSDMLEEFLQRPGMENLLLPGGNSDVLQILPLHSPLFGPDLRAEARAAAAAQLRARNEAIKDVGQWLVVTASAIFISQGQAMAAIACNLAQQRFGGENNALYAFHEAVNTASSAGAVAVQAISDPVAVVTKPWHVLGEIQVPGTGGMSLALFVAVTANMALAPFRPQEGQPSEAPAPLARR